MRDNKLNESKVGALWANTAKSNGVSYLSGSIVIDGRTHKIVCFGNNKQKDTQPDWNIYLSRDKNYAGTTSKEEEDVPF